MPQELQHAFLDAVTSIKEQKIQDVTVRQCEKDILFISSVNARGRRRGQSLNLAKQLGGLRRKHLRGDPLVGVRHANAHPWLSFTCQFVASLPPKLCA